MANPITMIREAVEDPIEFLSITLPTFVLMILIFAFKEEIHPDLARLPDPLSGNILGVAVIVLATLFLSLLIKQISHDTLNYFYDKTYAKFKRRKGDTWYHHAIKTGKIPSDLRGSAYAFARDTLAKQRDPILPKVNTLEIQSKLARSMALILFLVSALLFFVGYWQWGSISLTLAIYTLYAFYSDRWQASEELDRALPGGTERLPPGLEHGAYSTSQPLTLVIT